MKIIRMKTLIIGGAASGKSKYAEDIAIKTKLEKVYLATANIYDDEMQEKIERHKLRRGEDWLIISEPLKATKKISLLKDKQIMLFDCATMWLTNQIQNEVEIHQEIEKLIDAINLSKGSIITVTNEVGSGIVPENSMARQFRELQGLLNQKLAANADTVIKVIAGLPLVLKEPV